MKHIGIFILLVFLTSCGVTITYGDISVLNNNGETIRQWDNCLLEETGYEYNPTTKSSQKVRYYYGINRNEGISFKDKTGEIHYVSGGIIIIDNIKDVNDESNYNEKSTVNESVNSEYNELKKQYSEKKQYLKTNKGKISDKEVEFIKLEMKVIKRKIQVIENTLYDHTNED